MFTNKKAIDILESMCGRESAVYFALSTTKPNRDGTNITEPQPETGYKRVKIQFSQIDGDDYTFALPAYDEIRQSVVTKNQSAIMFPEVLSSWGTLTHFAIFNQSTDGQAIGYGDIVVPLTPTQNQIPVIAVNNAILELK